MLESPPLAPGFPQLLRLPSPHAVLTTPVDRFGTYRLAMALSRAGILKSLWPSRNAGPVGIHNFPFGACSSFTRVTACGVARPPIVDFVTRLPIPTITHRDHSSATQAYRQNSWGGTCTH